MQRQVVVAVAATAMAALLALVAVNERGRRSPTALLAARKSGLYGYNPYGYDYQYPPYGTSVFLCTMHFGFTKVCVQEDILRDILTDIRIAHTIPTTPPTMKMVSLIERGGWLIHAAGDPYGYYNGYSYGRFRSPRVSQAENFQLPEYPYGYDQYAYDNAYQQYMANEQQRS
eukprot:756101-Hanusia_phi.AAC.2